MNIDIHSVIETERIVTHYQPIINLSEQRIVGIEALSRGTNCDENIIMPKDLYSHAKLSNLCLDLDRLCRRKALEGFKQIEASSDYMIFLNMNADIIDMYRGCSAWTQSVVEELDIDPSSVAIEVVESNVQNEEMLISLTDYYKANGFLIVLDDFGSNHSNLNRVFSIKPDVIKIDKELIRNIGQSYYKQSIMESIIQLCHKIGALPLAEGIENADELLFCYKQGISLFQGFYFSKPLDISAFPLTECHEKLISLETSIQEKAKLRVEMDQIIEKAIQIQAERIVRQMENTHFFEFYSIINETAERIEHVESIYILNMEGKQVAGSQHPQNGGRRRKLFCNSNFNADHSLRDYFTEVYSGTGEMYVSPKYISKYSGKKCKTVSTQFVNGAGDQYILCVDFTCKNN